MIQTFALPYTEVLLPQPSEAFPTQRSIITPLIRCSLIFQGRQLPFTFLAVVDSGADHCAFPAVIGRQASIPIESGKRHRFTGVGGEGLAYFHQVTVQVLIEGRAWRFDCYAGFTPALDPLGIGLLGRDGFFELFEEIIFDQKRRVVKFTASVASTSPKAP